MSKEQTIEEGLKEVLEVIDGNGVPNMNWVRNKLHELLTKEAQQREELVKAVAVESYEVGIDDFYQDGEEFFDCVIKPKYLNK